MTLGNMRELGVQRLVRFGTKKDPAAGATSGAKIK
jgi:hypothetical protein